MKKKRIECYKKNNPYSVTIAKVYPSKIVIESTSLEWLSYGFTTRKIIERKKNPKEYEEMLRELRTFTLSWTPVECYE